jgi:hypothetical protein
VTEGTEVDTDELRTFADGVEHRGESIGDRANDAASFLSDRFAFGALNAFFVNDLLEAADRAVDGLRKLGTAAHADATEVRDTADTYDRTEEKQVHRFGGENDG